MLTTTKGHNHVADLWKLKPNNPNLDLVNVNANEKCGLISSIGSQDIERKWNFNDNQGQLFCWKIAKIYAWQSLPRSS